MRKFVYVPVIDLGQQAKGQFLEIMNESTCFGGINMNALKSCGLTKHIAVTKAILTQLNIQPHSAHLYVTSFLDNVGNTQGVNLGLVLACLIQAPACPYQKIIVTGQLNTTNEHLTVTEAIYFEAKIQAILNLGNHAQPIPFFFPQAMATKNTIPLLARLEALNIVLKPIDTLFDVLSDFDIPHKNFVY